MASAESQQALWTAVRKAREDTSPASIVRAMYCATSCGGPNTKAAADALEVSQRAVRRWVKAGQPRVRSAFADAVTSGYQARKDTAASRRAQLSTRREASQRTKGTTMAFYGKVAVSADPRNVVNRSTTVDISPEAMNCILDATLAGDDDATQAALEDALSEAFGGSVNLDITAAKTFHDHTRLR